MTRLTDILFAVEVPEGATNFQFAIYGGLNLVGIKDGHGVFITDKFGTDRLKIIGSFNSLNDEQASMLVEHRNEGVCGNWYRDYGQSRKRFSYAAPKNALRSLLESKGLTPSTKQYLIIKKV